MVVGVGMCGLHTVKSEQEMGEQVKADRSE